MMPNFHKLKLVMQKFQDTYPNQVSLAMTAAGSGNIKLDTSRGCDVGYDILLEWNNWEDLVRKLCQFNEYHLLSDKPFERNAYLVEQCRPNSYYR